MYSESDRSESRLTLFRFERMCITYDCIRWLYDALTGLLSHSDLWRTAWISDLNSSPHQGQTYLTLILHHSFA